MQNKTIKDVHDVMKQNYQRQKTATLTFVATLSIRANTEKTQEKRNKSKQNLPSNNKQE